MRKELHVAARSLVRGASQFVPSRSSAYGI